MWIEMLKELKKVFTVPLSEVDDSEYGGDEDEFDNDDIDKFKIMTDDEFDDLYLKQERNTQHSKQIEAARNNEKKDLYNSIKVYEKFVKMGYINTSIPYDRLAIIYRKLKLYDKEILICKIAVERFGQTDLNVIEERFKERLQKAQILKAKNN